ncbi:HAD-IIA family hydrolase [Variovorax gossypii]|uniref:HAD-IIA family hydrolase n=1 Tax=Variovorax gossypii TaxID=1679495 RepID=A0A3S0J6X6_9BURK|nr:HAD-IIA family hydrolase [Variovorax gossypii]RTQ32915.1 HAD-IIA family hydrolase [Variovorax gossypii]
MALKALLIDIDGTLIFRGEAIVGANRALQEAAEAGLAVRLLTNISARLPHHIAAGLRAGGILVPEDAIQTAGMACSAHIRGQPGASCHLLVPDAMAGLFEGIRRDDRQPDFVVVGDVAERFDYALLNDVFRMLRDGARLVVPHRNLYWFDGEGPARLDAGAFIVGLEAAAGQTAVVTGKPSPVFFQAALDAVGVTADEALVVGDDLLTDIEGARASGIASVLVRTGKGETPRASEAAAPSAELQSIAGLMPYLRDAGHLAR